MERVIDVHAHDVPLSRKLPTLFRHWTGALPVSHAWRDRVEGAKLSDLIEDMDRGGVATSLVILEAEAEEFFQLAARHPGRLFGLAYFDSSTPRRGLASVCKLCDAHPDLILGVHTAMPALGQDPRLRDFVLLYQFCMARELPVQFDIGASDGAAASWLTALGVLAATYPRLTVLCLDPGGRCHRDAPGVVHQFSNLLFAAGGPPEPETDTAGAPRALRELSRQAGRRKLMFGSNWQGRDGTYLDALASLRALPWWQRSHVGWRTAARVYGPRILGASTTHTGSLSSTR